MPMPLTKIRSIKFTNFFELILSILENATDEKFWQGLLGERLTKLGQRYFGNDFVMLGILFYVTPILRTNWESLIRYLFHRSIKQTKTLNVRVYYYDCAYNAIDTFIKKNTEQIPGLTEAIGTYTNNHNNDDDDEENKKPQIGLYPRNNTTNKIKYKGYTIDVAHKNGDDDDEKSNKISYIDISMEVSRLESIDVLKTILQEWADIYNDTEDNTIDVLNWNNYDTWDYKDSFEPRGLASVNLPNGVKENIHKDMERFLNSKDWYKNRSLPYRRGYLFYGVPGSGKTSLTQALAGELGLDMAIIKLTEINSDSDFQEMMSAIPEKTIIIIEDIDHYDKSNTEHTISISGLLNGLDGINGSNGSMVFMTCNDINKLEPALLRPGRIDVKIEFTYATHDQVESMYWRFFNIKKEEIPITTTNTTMVKYKKRHDNEDSLLPPTPPNEQESDHEENKDQSYLKMKLKEFLTLIPENTVTTAELQNLFVTVFLECGPDMNNSEELITKLFNQVPGFLERTRLDREQAKKHDAKVNGGSSSNSDNDKKIKEDDKIESTCHCKKEELNTESKD